MDINRFTPTGHISKNHLISLKNYSEEDIFEILHLANQISKAIAVGEKPLTLKNKKIALIAKNGLTYQRIAFENAVSALSGNAMVCSMSGSELESLVGDKLTVAAIVGYGVNALVVQTSEIGDAEAMEKLVSLPVVNAYGKSGPCEALAALLTVWRRKGRLDGLKISLIGSPEEFADSFAYAFSICGLDLTFVCPEEKTPSDKLLDFCRQFGSVSVSHSVQSGIKGADVVLVSEDGLDEKFTLTQPVYEENCPGALILHGLPVPTCGQISQELLSVPNFCGLQQALSLSEIEMSVLSLLLKK